MMIDRTELVEFGGGGASGSGIGVNCPGTSSSCMDSNPENNVNKAEYYIQQLNSSNAKKVALCLVLGFICYHGLIHLRYGEFNDIIIRITNNLSKYEILFNFKGTDSCKWLLSDGRYKGNREWQPYGCMMHKYTQT